MADEGMQATQETQLTKPRVPSPHQYQNRSYCSCDQIPLCVTNFEKVINGDFSFLNSVIMVTMSYELLQKGRILRSLKNEV